MNQTPKSLLLAETSLGPVPRPISSGERPNAVPSREAKASGPRPRVLYVDDEPTLRKLAEFFLVESGYDVETATNGAEAWDALQDRDYDLLITDNQMPVLTGQELVRKVRRARMDVPIILASGTFGACPFDDLPWAECGALLAKPFSPDQLLSVVRQVLSVNPSPTSAHVQMPLLEEFPDDVPCAH